MSSTDRFRKALEQAAAQRGGPGAPMTVQASRGRARLEMDVADADRYGLIATETRVSSGKGPPPDPGTVIPQAQEMARRVTYLEESLALIEMDGRRGRAVLRSASPRVDGGTIRYYEAVLEGGRSATLRRYRFESGGRGRRPEPANLSMENAARLAGDLLDLFSGR